MTVNEIRARLAAERAAARRAGRVRRKVTVVPRQASPARQPVVPDTAPFHLLAKDGDIEE